MTDPTIFDGWEKRVEAEAAKPQRWCKCGHIEGAHWSSTIHVVMDSQPWEMKVATKPAISMCHYGSGRRACKCTEFRPKKRKNRLTSSRSPSCYRSSSG